MNIGYCTLIYDGSELPLALEHISSAGYNGLELYPKDLEWALQKYSIQELKDLLLQYNVRVSGVMGGILTRDKDLKDFIKAADIGCALDCETVFFVGSNKINSNLDEFYSVCKKGCRYLHDKNMTAVLHHHAGTIAETVGQTIDIIEAIDETNLGVCFDSVHYALFEDDLIDSIYRLKDYIKYVHLKDIKKDKEQLFADVPVSETTWGNLDHIASEYTGLEEGVVDNREVVRSLLKIGYRGWWIIEIEKQEYDREKHASKNIEVLNRYFKSCK